MVASCDELVEAFHSFKGMTSLITVLRMYIDYAYRLPREKKPRMLRYMYSTIGALCSVTRYLPATRQLVEKALDLKTMKYLIMVLRLSLGVSI